MTKLVASHNIAKAPNETRQGQMLEVTCCYLHNRISLICVIAFGSSLILCEDLQYFFLQPTMHNIYFLF